MDWFVLICQPIFMPVAIQFGVEINPIAFVPPATVESSGVYVLIDLISIDLR